MSACPPHPETARRGSFQVTHCLPLFRPLPRLPAGLRLCGRTPTEGLGTPPGLGGQSPPAPHLRGCQALGPHLQDSEAPARRSRSLALAPSPWSDQDPRELAVLRGRKEAVQMASSAVSPQFLALTAKEPPTLPQTPQSELLHPCWKGQCHEQLGKRGRVLPEGQLAAPPPAQRQPLPPTPRFCRAPMQPHVQAGPHLLRTEVTGKSDPH